MVTAKRLTLTGISESPQLGSLCLGEELTSLVQTGRAYPSLGICRHGGLAPRSDREKESERYSRKGLAASLIFGHGCFVLELIHQC